MSSEYVIKIKDTLNSSFPSTRESARKVFSVISSVQDNHKVILDFDSIIMASRSFIDELLAALEQIPDRSVEFKSLSPVVESIYQAVCQSREKFNNVYQRES